MEYLDTETQHEASHFTWPRLSVCTPSSQPPTEEMRKIFSLEMMSHFILNILFNWSQDIIQQVKVPDTIILR